MIGVINPNTTQNIDAQIKAVGKSTYQVAPGEPIPKEASSSLTNANEPTGSAAPGNSGDSGHHLSGGAIAGIVVGGIAFLAICAALFFYVGRAKSLKEVVKRNSMPMDARGSYGPASPYPPSVSPYPGSPGFAPYSPNMQQAEYGGQLPAYGQQNVTDPHMSGVFSPMMSPRLVLTGAKEMWRIENSLTRT